MTPDNILFEIRTHLRIPLNEFSYRIGINRITYTKRERTENLDLAKVLTLEQYLNLRNICSDSIYCNNLLDEVEKQLGFKMIR